VEASDEAAPAEEAPSQEEQAGAQEAAPKEEAAALVIEQLTVAQVAGAVCGANRLQVVCGRHAGQGAAMNQASAAPSPPLPCASCPVPPALACA
jgi:hypothetical protein